MAQIYQVDVLSKGSLMVLQEVLIMDSLDVVLDKAPTSRVLERYYLVLAYSGVIEVFVEGT